MSDFLKEVDTCMEILRQGGVILYPTDTVWGLGCDATNESAVNKIYQIKQRPGEKSMIVLLAEERDILKYVTAPDPSVFDLLQKLSRPTTIIYPGAINMAPNVINSDGTVAIRIVKDPFCKHLVKRLRKPLISSSANVSGEKTPSSFHEIPQSIISKVDYVVQYRQQETVAAAPSSIIKLNPDGTQTIIRE